MKRELSWGETLRRTAKAVSIWWTMNPKLIISAVLFGVVRFAVPYVSAYLIAQIINELAGGAWDVRRLWTFVILEVALAALLNLIRCVFMRWMNYERDADKFEYRKLFVDKMLDMDYSILDRAETVNLLTRKQQDESWNGWGLTPVLFTSWRIVGLIVQIAGGIGLSVSLFTSKVAENAGNLLFLNHPLCTVIVLCSMLGTMLLGIATANKSQAYWEKADVDGQKAQRIFSFFGNDMVVQKERAVDLRMYDQQEICDYYLDKHNTLGVRSQYAADARGPMGAWSAISNALIWSLTGLAYLFVCLKALGGAFGIGSVTQYITALTCLFTGIGQFVVQMGVFRVNAVYLQTTYEFLDIPNEMYQGSCPRKSGLTGNMM